MAEMAHSNFFDDDWGLLTESAKDLYNQVVRPLRAQEGITDAHTHLSQDQILKNERFTDIFQALVLDGDPRWRNRDHYIIQLMAGEGIPFATWYNESIPNKAKWNAFAKAFPKLATTQVGLWTQLELNRTLGIDGLLSEGTSERIWEEANAKLAGEDYTPQALIRQADVRVLSTTDDAIDTLETHKALTGALPSTRVLPTYRPDASMNIFKPEWKEYVSRLTKSKGQDQTLDGLLTALRIGHQHFADHGCVASDHGLEVPYGWKVEKKDAEAIFDKVFRKGEAPTERESAVFISYMMDQFCAMDRDRKWATQFHFGAKRNVNSYLLGLAGADAGGDLAQAYMDVVTNLFPLLSKYASTGDRTVDSKIILYSLSPEHYSTIAQLARVFPGVRAGMAWWFNDNYGGMMRQLEQNAGVLPHSRYAGMVCDGRKLLSIWQRHDVYDRVICTWVANMVRQQTIHASQAADIVRDMCCYNQANLFGFNGKR